MGDYRHDESYARAKLQEAIALAEKAHAGQVDKAGAPYIQHPETVCRIVADIMLRWPNVDPGYILEAQIVAYLHDILEDTEITVQDLWDVKVPTDCILAVKTLTKKPEVDYDAYISEIKKCKLSAIVKIADMTHNSDLVRLSAVTPEDEARREKYRKSIACLSEFTCEKCGGHFDLSLMGEKSTRIGEILCEPCLAEYEIEWDETEEYMLRQIGWYDDDDAKG